MDFVPGDHVHIRSVGKGIVREVRNGGRLVVEVNGRAIVTSAEHVERFEAQRERKRPARKTAHVYEPPRGEAASIDLHGMTVDEAGEVVIAFIDRALRDGSSEVHIIHGRSGGRLKSALHAQLKRLPTVRSYALDPRNAGVTIVRL